MRCKNCPVEGYEITFDKECLRTCIKFNMLLPDEKLLRNEKTGPVASK
jgi:hypothetical protein